jgi:molybdopterin molybdotransferase
LNVIAHLSPNRVRISIEIDKGKCHKSIMAEQIPIGLPEALALTLSNIRPLPVEEVALTDAVDRIVSQDLYAKVDSPSVDASLKDGYAVVSHSVAEAASGHPVRLKLAGHAAAGGMAGLQVTPETTVQVLTGAAIPADADAVVSEEFTFREGPSVMFIHYAEPGRNVLTRGSDVTAGDLLIHSGERLTPGRIGLLAAAGYSRVGVVRRPVVGIAATGDEVVAPGSPLTEGKLYASNMLTLEAWCRRHGMATHAAIVRDDANALSNALWSLASRTDAVITSGGAWTGDRDLVAKTLRRLGWRQIFHRVRMGPGKAVGFGLLGDKPVFILPGGPPSCLLGFLQIALPGLLKQGGHTHTELPLMRVRAAQDLESRNSDWTHFIFGQVRGQADEPQFIPLRRRSRLLDMAEASAVAAIPEGCRKITAGALFRAQLLTI